jgi:hypothetical protein
MYQDPNDVMPGDKSRVERLVSKNIDYSLVEVNRTTYWQIQNLLVGTRTRKIQRRISMFVRFQTKIFHDSIGILEVADKIYYGAKFLANESPQTSAQLLIENAFRLSRPKKEKTFDKG